MFKLKANHTLNFYFRPFYYVSGKIRYSGNFDLVDTFFPPTSPLNRITTVQTSIFSTCFVAVFQLLFKFSIKPNNDVGFLPIVYVKSQLNSILTLATKWDWNSINASFRNQDLMAPGFIFNLIIRTLRSPWYNYLSSSLLYLTEKNCYLLTL